MIITDKTIEFIKNLDLPKQDYDTKQRFNKLPNDKNQINYSCQKEHWINWLNSKKGKDFKIIYNRIICAPMLCWLAEALSIDVSDVKIQMKSIQPNNDKTATMREESRIFRTVIPYKTIQKKMENLLK